MQKKYQTILPLILIGLSIVITLIPSIPRAVGITAMAISAILLIYFVRGSIYFSRAGRLISARKPGYKEKAIALFDKAERCGVPAQFALIIGTCFIQDADMERGRKDLEDVIGTNNPKLLPQAKSALSMYYWIKKDFDKAIDLSLEAKNAGVKDTNLYINLGTYYLSANRTRDFEKLLKEAHSNNKDSIAFIDMQAQCSILKGSYEKAGNFLTSLFEKAQPTYQDPYVHMAMVYMYYGKIDKAIEQLKLCLEKVHFSNISIFRREEIEKLISTLESECKWSLVQEIVSDPLSFMNGKLPENLEKTNEPLFPEMPTFKIVEKKEELSQPKEEEPDEIDTDLNDDDEEWLKKHNISTSD